MHKKEHYLYPSTIYSSASATQITTVLGTCIAVCLWDSTNKIGGINHYMLPFWNGDGLASPKYGNIAIQKLYKKLIDLGADKNHLVAKIFGGKRNDENDSFRIGIRNEHIALELLNELDIPVVAQSTGGPYGRKILFNSYTGEVFMKYIKGQHEKN